MDNAAGVLAILFLGTVGLIVLLGVFNLYAWFMGRIITKAVVRAIKETAK